MPFITEEIYQFLPDPEESIMIADYPQKDSKLINKGAEKKAKKFFDLIYLVRNIRWEMNVPQDKKVDILIKSSDNDLMDFVKENQKDILYLAKAQSVKIDYKLEKPSGSATGANEICEVYIPLEGIIDINREYDRLKKELEKTNIDYIRTKSKLRNSNFISKAPKEIIEKEKIKMEEFESKIEKLDNNLAVLKDLV
jgi:valyl-tRNA synthetase